MKRTLPPSLFLLAYSTSVAVGTSSDYESKMQAALDMFTARSGGILSRAILNGYDDADLSHDSLTDKVAEIYADFGLDAITNELDIVKERNDLLEDYDDIFEELTEQNGTKSDTISYEQLREWEDVVDIIGKLKDGEFLNLWRRATGSESQEGDMTSSQFVLFNDLLDTLVMAKVDFKALTKRLPTQEIPYERLYKWPALSEDMPDEDFHDLWKQAVGADVLKGVMNYQQFLVFYDLAEEWLDRDIEDVVEEEKERRANYWMKSGGSKSREDDEDEDDSDDDGGYGDIIANENVWKSGFYIPTEELPTDIKEGLESTDEDIRNEAKLRRRLDPDKWAEFSYWDIYAFFGCEQAFDKPRPLWTDQQWRDVREFYHEFVEEDKKDGNVGKIRSYQFAKEEIDLSQNAIPFQSGEKGRGLQAVRDIKAGETIFTASNNTIVFNYGHTWRKLLFAINDRYDDPGIACDMHVWSWVQDLYDGGPMKILMDLDSGSLLNEGRDEPDWDPPNVQCGKPDATRCDMDYYAFRDIKKGDELLIDYREFAWLESWPAMGL